MKYRFVWLAAFLTGLYSPMASACRCLTYETQAQVIHDAAGRADQVFVGTVDSVDEILADVPPGPRKIDIARAFSTHLLHVSITERFKGRSNGVVTMKPSNCRGYSVRPGEKWAFFVAADGEPVTCSPMPLGDWQNAAGKAPSEDPWSITFEHLERELHQEFRK